MSLSSIVLVYSSFDLDKQKKINVDSSSTRLATCDFCDFSHIEGLLECQTVTFNGVTRHVQLNIEN